MHPKPGIPRQRGLAMLVLVTLLALISAYLIASGFSKTSSEVTLERDQRSRGALLEAKAALIAWAANPDPTLTQIGALPCPDRKLPTHAQAGKEESTCNTDLVRIGRLPWKTLNVSDLRDASGEQLWYVLSGNFRKKSGTTVINSDTQGQITIGGSSSANNVVAIIIAPGAALLSQNRDKTNLAALNDASNYLEGANAGANDNAFETRVPPNDRDPVTGDLIFNDRVLAITQADLFAVVEPVASAKIRSPTGVSSVTVKTAIEVYRTTWGSYPFPAAFGDPGTSTFQGTVGATEGLLPLTTDSTFITWKTSSPNPTVAAAPGNPGTVDVGQSYTDCANSSTTQLECQFDWCGTSPNFATVRITATANNVGRAFVARFIDSDLTVVRTSASVNDGNWMSSSATITASSYALAADGNGSVTLTLQMPSRPCGSMRTARIRIPVPTYHSITSTDDPDTGWFVSNQWHKVTYYAVSPGYLPAGCGGCNTQIGPLPPACVTPGPPPSCLAVNGLPGADYPANNKQGILILMGRSLNGTARPSGTLGNYLEGNNASTGDYIFEHRIGAPGAVNDRVVVLSP